ncbi:MAG: glycosyltransferase family 4 protein [Candidatus Caldarchaeales archaeon]
MISSCFPPSRGGVEKVVYELVKRISRNNQVTIITTTRGCDPKISHAKGKNIRIVRYVEKYHLIEAPIMFPIPFRILLEDFDILHVHASFPIMMELAILLAKIKRKPIIVTYHFDATSFKAKRFEKLVSIYYLFVRAFLKLADVIVATTVSYAMTSRVLRGLYKKLVIIPNGVDLDKFNSLESNDNSHNNFNSHRILFVGQLKYYKGLDILLKALRFLKDRNQNNIVLSIVGSGPEYSRLKSLVEELGLSEGEEVVFHGNVSDQELLSLYKNSSMLVLPSLDRREAFGLVLLEALASGTPVIASDIPGVREIAKLGGILVEAGNPIKLGETILRLFDDRSLREICIKTAREKIKDYDWDQVVRKYSYLYDLLYRKRYDNIDKKSRKILEC